MGSGSLGAPGTDASDQRVATSASRIRCSARETARSNGTSPSAGSGIQRAMSCSWHTVSSRSDSTSGRAMVAGTGVTRPTQWLDSPGESTLIGRMMRRGSPAARA